MVIIKFYNLASFTQTTIIDNIVYELRFDWNDRGQYWTISIKDADGVALVSGVKVVLGYPLVTDIIKPGLPPGVLIVGEGSGAMVRLSQNDFIEDKAFIGYITEDEIATLEAGGVV